MRLKSVVGKGTTFTIVPKSLGAFMIVQIKGGRENPQRKRSAGSPAVMAEDVAGVEVAGGIEYVCQWS